MFCWISKRPQFLLRLRRETRGISLVLLVLLVSCTSNPPKTGELYGIDSLLAQQIGFLSKRAESISKASILNGEDHTVLQSIKDSVAWKKELEIFEALDLVNKPVNRALYQVSIDADTKSNLKIRSISTTEDLPVRYLKLYYHGSPDRLKKLEARYEESNLLYRSARDLTITFEEIGGKAVMTSYSISGGQKMFLDDSVQYDINGQIKFKAE
jgi:hypothetical protein